MVKIILRGEQAKNIFIFYNEDGESYYSPKNNEAREYCKSLVGHYSGYDDLCDYKNIFYKKAISSNIDIIENDGIIEDNEIFVFEFPDNYSEEKLFYFCLKYEGEIIDV